MKYKNIFISISLISIVILASYLFVNKKTKQSEVLPPAPAIKQRVLPTSANAKEIKVTFIELGSVGCTPCDMMRPILDEIEKEYEGQVNVRFWDVKSLLGGPYAEKYKVRLIPTQVFLDKDGNEYYRHIGFFPKEEIIKILQLRSVK